MKRPVLSGTERISVLEIESLVISPERFEDHGKTVNAVRRRK